MPFSIRIFDLRLKIFFFQSKKFFFYKKRIIDHVIRILISEVYVTNLSSSYYWKSIPCFWQDKQKKTKLSIRCDFWRSLLFLHFLICRSSSLIEFGLRRIKKKDVTLMHLSIQTTRTLEYFSFFSFDKDD